MDLQSFSECFRLRRIRRAALSRSVNHEERGSNLRVFQNKHAPVFEFGIQLALETERHVFTVSVGG